MKMSVIIAGLCLSASAAFGQQANRLEAEQKAILDMCGCYEVSFDYAETFSPDADYQFKDRYHTKGLEWIVPEEKSDNKLVLQHLLIVGDTMVIKHWREDWEYQATELLAYRKGKHWDKMTLTAESVAGQWTQRVFEVDDSPRYEGSATWFIADGRRFWESTVDAPLPRREYTKRDDYNVMKRTNRHEITDYGFLHEQDNDKIIRSEAGDQLLAQEKGLNVYRKVEDSKCRVAQEWWAANRTFWADVRAEWQAIFNEHSTIKLKRNVDGKALVQLLFAMGDEAAKNPAKNYRTEARTVLRSFLSE